MERCPARIGGESVTAKKAVKIAEAIQVSVSAKKCGEVYLIETVHPIAGLTMVKPPLPAVGQDAPVSLSAHPEIEVYLVVRILVVERVASYPPPSDPGCETTPWRRRQRGRY